MRGIWEHHGRAWSVAILILVSGWGNAAWGVEEGEPFPNSRQELAGPGRTQGDLNGTWEVSLDEGQNFVPIQVPGTIEDQIDELFDGRSLYRRRVQFPLLQDSERLILKFTAVATHAVVSINGRPVGEHLGGWTPFWLDATNAVRELRGEEGWLEVAVDERVGHNTQGFLPIVTQHFGGIWQPVAWEILSEPTVLTESLGIFVGEDPLDLRFEIPVYQPTGTQSLWQLEMRPALVVSGEATEDTRAAPWSNVDLQWAPPRAAPSSVLKVGAADEWQVQLYEARARLTHPLLKWSPESPQQYEFRWTLVSPQSSVAAGAMVRQGFRDFVAIGDRFELNSRPLVIRGVLNWGYLPSSVAPTLSEEAMRREIEFAQQRGFNLMKFCLWIPPRRYLELCDELGMLAWVEYPTWHPRLDQQHLEELRREYGEFFQFDRRHGAVVLRSLTCETGPSADIEVIRSLYEQCKQAVPGAIVEDDSSWISWNRVHDFYDDHPYGNNHTWVATLSGLKDYIAQRERKPLVLGEAIAADTWSTPTVERLERAAQSRAHGLWFVADNARWSQQLAELAARWRREFSADQLFATSQRYAAEMRKFQIEAYQREVPWGGYVVSVIRDFPKAAMGLIDDLGNPKSTPADWAYHGDRLVLWQSFQDRRSFASGTTTTWDFFTKDTRDSSPLADSSRLRVQLRDPRGEVRQQFEPKFQSAVNPSAWEGSLSNQGHWSTEVRLPVVTRPERWELVAEWYTGKPEVLQARNRWHLWLIPIVEDNIPVRLHPSASELASLWPVQVVTDATSPKIAQVPLLTRVVDEQVLDELQSGKLVILIPNGQRGSFPTAEHWFLRGAPVVLPRIGEAWLGPVDSAVTAAEGAGGSRSLVADLQHFDLAGPVIPRIDHYLNSLEPWMVLWDNHDLRETRTHGLVFRLPVAERGDLLVSTLGVANPETPAGQWVFAQVLKDAQARADLALNDVALRQANWEQLQAEVRRKSIPLHERTWKFRVDPQEIGVAEAWFATDRDDREWADLRVDRHWDGQGYGAYDGWAWYRTTWSVPLDWHAPRTFLNFTGVDDYAVVYVNGRQIGTIGDLKLKQTGFESKVSWDVTEFVQTSKQLQITVAVYDWYGAGGIFRPVSISTEPLSERPPILQN